MGNDMLVGKKVNLRALEISDLDNNMMWVNDREVTRWLSTFTWPTSRKTEEQWLTNKLTSPGATDRVLAIETKDGTYLGNIGLHGIDYISGVAELGIVIGRKEQWGKGYGPDAIRTLLDFAFRDLRLRKIFLRVLGNNIRAQKCYSKIGFKEVGRLKAHQLKDGNFEDLIYMEIFAEEFRVPNGSTEDAACDRRESGI